MLLALGRFGATAPMPAGDAGAGVDSIVLALLTLFEPSAAAGLDARFELRLDDRAFTAEIAGGRIALVRGAADDPEATLETDPATLAALLWEGRPLADARRSGELELSGSVPAARRFLSLFGLPDGAGTRP